MLRVARMYVSSRAVAEEVVQEAWLGVISGIGRFEGRSSLKTWIFRIVTNVAKTRGEREGRSIPLSSVAGAEEGDGRTVDADRFLTGGRWAGHWSQRQAAGQNCPKSGSSAARRSPSLQDAIAALTRNPANRDHTSDVEGWSSDEVCDVLELSETNQRVLLHRGTREGAKGS